MSEQVAEQVAQPEAAPEIQTPAEVASGGSGDEFLGNDTRRFKRTSKFITYQRCSKFSTFICQRTKIDRCRQGAITRKPYR